MVHHSHNYTRRVLSSDCTVLEECFDTKSMESLLSFVQYCFSKGLLYVANFTSTALNIEIKELISILQMISSNRTSHRM